MVYLFLSAVGSVSVALLFVASLYVWKSSREAKTRADRDNPEVVVKRFLSGIAVSVLCVLMCLYCGISIEVLGFSLELDKTLYAVGAGLALTFMLFLGPLAQLLESFDVDDVPYCRGTEGLLTFRNLIFAPFIEELVYRSVILSLCIQGGWSMQAAVLISMFSFALSHVHHLMIGTPRMTVLFQLCYTSIFGLMSSFLFLRTGIFLVPALTHTFCNYMGFPRIDLLYRDRYSAKSMGFMFLYLLGVYLYFSYLFVLTEPAVHGSEIWDLAHGVKHDRTIHTTSPSEKVE